MTLPVDVIRSRNRRKTVQAREVDGRLRVMIPAWMSSADEAYWVAEMQRRLGGRPPALDDADLTARAAALAARYRLPVPTTTVWSDRQARRWGSCTPANRTVRVSSRLATAPAWVLDFVIVHELAHLVVAAHDARFAALVDRYPRAQRAQGFLEGWGMIPDGGEELPTVVGVAHVRIPFPAGSADEVAAFYGGLLGLPAIEGPGPGLWFGHDLVRVHAQPGETDRITVALAVHGLADLRSRLGAAGWRVDGSSTDGCAVHDPFGNRLELIDRTGTLSIDEPRRDLRRPRRQPSALDDSAAALT